MHEPSVSYRLDEILLVEAAVLDSNCLPNQVPVVQ